MNTLEEWELDAMRELVNIASGKAASALAMLVGRRTMIEVPRVSVESIHAIATIFGAPDQPIVVVAMQLLGDVRGQLLFLMPVARAQTLIAMLLQLAEGTTAEFDESGRSAIEETANVLAGAYAGTLGALIEAVVMISVPAFSVEPPVNALARAHTISDESARALYIETSISIGPGRESCDAHLVLIPQGGTLERLTSELARRVIAPEWGVPPSA